MKTGFSISLAESSQTHRKWNSQQVCETWIKELLLSKLPSRHEASLTTTTSSGRERRLNRELRALRQVQK